MARPSVEDLHVAIAEGDGFTDPFTLVRDVAHAYALAEADADRPADQSLLRARELVIRLLDHQNELGPARPLHDALLARLGLYPYLDQSALAGSDLLAYEAHRPLGEFGETLVWHRDQARAYARLLDGESVILAAPTSFGKSRVIDGVVMSGRFRNILVIVPTVALIDEARRRLTRLAGDEYKVVTHVSQAPEDKTIYVLTQERVLEFEELPELNLFVIDEFYKLALERDEGRARLLNLAFYRLLQTKTQFYLLGPNIGGIASSTLAKLECVYIDSWDTTVAVETILVKRGRRNEKLLRVCRECAERDERTLVYCSSPEQAEKVGAALAEAGIGESTPGAREAAAWVATHFHPQWRVVKAIESGIGVHHGQIPRALGHYLVSAFDAGELNFLVCTPTLIEGVNTKAKNVVVYDSKHGPRTMDLFTFNNIRGRSGRMFEHATGRVYVFKKTPDPPLDIIDFPILSQPENAPPELYNGMNPDDLTPGAKAVLDEALEGAPVPAEVLEASPAVSIVNQLKLADAIKNMPRDRARLLGWKSPHPTGEQLRVVFQLVWEQGVLPRGRPLGASSVNQLIFWLNAMERGSTRELMDNQVDYAPERRDESIINVLRFQRSGLTFEVPKWLMTVDNLQKSLLPGMRLEPGDYRAYATRVENAFLAHPLGALDEYGVPIELARKLERQLVQSEDDDLDAVLARVAALDIEELPLTPFERRLLQEARTDLGAAVGGA